MRAMESVLAQTLEPLELIVVDDGSEDETQALVQSWATKVAGKLNVKLLQGANQGVSAARNWGVAESQGEWLAFLDSDDEWLPAKLEKQMQLATDQDHSIVHGEEIWIRKGVRVNPMKKHQKKGGDVFDDAVRLCCISPSTVVLKKSLFLKQGGFRDDFPVCEDYDLWLKITAFEQVGFVQDPVIKKYGGHEDQLSRQYFAMDHWRILALHSILQENLEPAKRKMAWDEMQKKINILLKGYRKHQNLRHYDEVFQYQFT